MYRHYGGIYMTGHPLLPPNQTPLEAAFIHAFDALFTLHPERYQTLHDAQHTPLLSVLANDKGVRHWDNDAADTIKRQQVGSAWAVRALSGTRAGIRHAMQSHGFTARFAPATPYHMHVTAVHNGLDTVTPTTLATLQSRLEEASNARDKVNLTLAIPTHSAITRGVAVRSTVTLRAIPTTLQQRVALAHTEQRGVSVQSTITLTARPA